MSVIADEYSVVFTTDVKGLSVADAALAAMRGQLQQNNQALRAYDTELLNTRSAMAEMARQIESARQSFGASSQVVKSLQNIYRDLGVNVRELSAGKAQLSAATRDLSGEESKLASEAKKVADEMATQQKRINDAFQALNSGSSAIGGLRSKLDSIAGQFSVMGAAATAAISGITISALKTGLGFDALKEQAQIAFTTMLGSGQAARQFLGELADFANRTPFEFPDLIRAAQRLKAMGFEAEAVIPTLTAVGDAAAAMGGNAQSIERITLAFTQMVAKGKVQAEEMRQLAEAGIPAWQILADKLNITVAEAMKRVEKRMIDGRTAVDLLIDGIEHGTKSTQAFGGMMDKQSHTLQGLASTIKDVATQALGNVLQPVFDKLRDSMQKVVDVLPKAVQWFQSLSPEIRNAALAIGLITAAMPAVTLGFSALAGLLSAMLSPIGLVVAAIGALAVAYITNLGGIHDSVDRFTTAMASLWQGHGNQVVQLVGGMWNAVVDLFGRNMQTVSNIMNAGSALLEGRWSEFLNRMVVNTGQGLLTGITGLLPIMVRGVADLLSKIASFISGVNVMDMARRFVQNAEGSFADAFRSFDMASFNIFGERAGDAAGLSFQDIFLRRVQQASQLSTKFAAAQMAAAISGSAQPIISGPGRDVAADKALKNIFGIDPPALAGAAKKAGAGVSKALVNGFDESTGGLDSALSKVNANISKLGDLFDPVTKKSRAGAQELKSALSEVAKSVNDFLSTAGISAKVTVADLAQHWSNFQTIIGKTDAFEHLKTALNAINLDRVTAGLNAFDTSLKINNGAIEISASAFEALKQKFPAVAAEIAKVGLTTKQVFPAMKVDLDGVAGKADETSKSINHYGDIWLEAMVKAQKAAMGALPSLKESLKQLKEAVESNSIFDDVKVGNEAAQWVQSIIKEFETEGERMGLTGEALMNYALEGLRKVAPSFTGEMKAVADRSVEQWKLSLYRLPGIWDEVFNKLGSTAKSWASSIFGVLDSVPGKFGSTISKIQSTVSQWAAFFNSILALIHKFNSDVPGSLGDVFGNIAGSVKKATADIQQSTQQIDQYVGNGLILAANDASDAGGQVGDAFKKMGADSQEGASQVSAAIGLAASSIGAFLSGQAIGGVKGSIIGGLQGALSGFAIGGIFGAAVGGIAGILGGIFSHKTDAQKQAEADALKQQQQNAAQAVEATKQTIIKTAADLAALFDSVADHVRVPQRKIAQFIADISALMSQLADGLKSVSAKATPELKTAAENFAPVVALAGNAVAVFEGLSRFVSVPQRAFDSFGAALSSAITTFSNVVTAVGDEAIGAAKRLSKRIGQMITEIKDGVDAFSGLVSFGGVPQRQMELFGAALTSAINVIGKILGDLEKNALPNAKNLAKRTGEIVSLIGSGVSSLTELSTFVGITQSAATLFRDGLLFAINAIVEVAQQVDSDLLAAAQRFSERAGASVSLIGTAISAFKDLETIKLIPSEALKILGFYIKQAVAVMIEIAGEIADDAATAASLFATKAGPVVNTVKDAVAAFNTLDSLQNVEGGPFDALKLYIRRAVTDMGQLAGEISDDLVSQANAFGGKIKGVFDAIGSAVSVFTGLSNLSGGRDVAGSQFPDIGRVLDFVLNGIRSGVDSLIKISGEVSSEGIAAALAFADKAKQMFEAVTTGAGAFKAIADMPPLSVSQWDDFFNRIVLMIQKLASTVSQAAQAHDLGDAFKSLATMMNDSLSVLIDTIDSKILNSANDVAVKLSNVFDALKTGLEVFALLRNYTSIPGVAFAGLIDDMNRALTGLDTLLSKAFDFNRLAVSFRDTIINAVGALRAGIQSIVNAGGAASGASAGNSFAGSSSFTPASFASSSYAGLSAGSQGSNRSAGGSSVTYQVNVNVNGNLIHQSKITDAVIDALVQAQRTGRLKQQVV